METDLGETQAIIGVSPRQAASNRPRHSTFSGLVGRTVGWAVLIAGAVLVLIPIYWMIVVALTPEGQSTTPSMGFFPKEVTLDNFVKVVATRPVGLWLGNSLIVALAATLTSLLVGVSAGYALSRFRVRGIGLIAIIIMTTQLIPHVSVVLPLYSMFRTLGLLNTHAAIVLAHVSVICPLVIWLSKGFFDEVPRELDESASLDGASKFRTFRSIALPLILPGLGAAFIYAFTVSWSELIFSRTLASRAELWITPVGLASFNSDYYTTIEPIMAASVIFALPIIVMFLLLQRSFISGLTGGSSKG